MTSWVWLYLKTSLILIVLDLDSITKELQTHEQDDESNADCDSAFLHTEIWLGKASMDSIPRRLHLATWGNICSQHMRIQAKYRLDLISLRMLATNIPPECDCLHYGSVFTLNFCVRKSGIAVFIVLFVCLQHFGNAIQIELKIIDILK